MERLVDSRGKGRDGLGTGRLMVDAGTEQGFCMGFRLLRLSVGSKGQVSRVQQPI